MKNGNAALAVKQRYASVLNAPEAAGRHELACHLLASTDLTASQVRYLLRDAPKGLSTAAAVAAHVGRLAPRIELMQSATGPWSIDADAIYRRRAETVKTYGGSLVGAAPHAATAGTASALSTDAHAQARSRRQMPNASDVYARRRAALKSLAS